MTKSNKFIWFALIGMLFIFASCEVEDEDDPFADPIEKFLGSWKCNEQEVPPEGLWVYDVVITRNPDNSSEILISNFNYQGNAERARALVTGNSLSIPVQRICDNTIEIRGNGNFSNREISLTYTTDDGADRKNFTATYFKP